MVTDQTPASVPKMRTHDVSVYYGDNKAVDSVTIEIPREFVTAFIGPSGCGKSTFLRALNRMNDTIASARVEGTIELDGEDIYRSKMDVVQLRARVGMVFQKPNPFPKSIFDNIAYGPRIHGLAEGRSELETIQASTRSEVEAATLTFDTHEVVANSFALPDTLLINRCTKAPDVASYLAVVPGVLRSNFALLAWMCRLLRPARRLLVWLITWQMVALLFFMGLLGFWGSSSLYFTVMASQWFIRFSGGGSDGGGFDGGGFDGGGFVGGGVDGGGVPPPEAGWTTRVPVIAG